MLLSILTDDKRLKSSLVLLAAYAMGKAGINTTADEIVGVAGAIWAAAGWIHALVKWVKSKPKS